MTDTKAAEEYARKTLGKGVERRVDSTALFYGEDLYKAHLAGQAHAERWIAVIDDTPKQDCLVLVWAKCLGVTYGWFHGGLWTVNDEPNFALDKTDRITFVTHWRPLPPAPRLSRGCSLGHRGGEED